MGWRGWILLGMLASAAGCATARTPDLQADLAALQAQVARLQQSQAAFEAELAALRKLRTSSGAPATDLAALDSRIASLEGQLLAMRQRVDDTLDRVNTLSQDVLSARELALRVQPPRTAPSRPPEGDGEEPVPSNPEGSATGLEDSRLSPAALEDTFSAAYADFTKGNYSLAIAGFQDFLKKYPASELADNAQFWIGESHFSQGDFQTAATQYDRVIQKYAKGDRVPAAYLKKGLCFLELGRAAEGVVLLQHLIQTYPTSEEAALARDRLQTMGVKP